MGSRAGTGVERRGWVGEATHLFHGGEGREFHADTEEVLLCGLRGLAACHPRLNFDLGEAAGVLVVVEAEGKRLLHHGCCCCVCVW